MQVQSAIASRPAYGRVCAQLSCLILHARTLQHLSLNEPHAVRPHCCTAVTAASQPPAGQCGNAHSMGAPKSACTRVSRSDHCGVSCHTLFRDPVRSPPRGCHARLVARWLDQLCPRVPFAQDTADSQRALPLGRSEEPPMPPQLSALSDRGRHSSLPATYRCSIVNHIN